MFRLGSSCDEKNINRAGYIFRQSVDSGESHERCFSDKGQSYYYSSKSGVYNSHGQVIYGTKANSGIRGFHKNSKTMTIYLPEKKKEAKLSLQESTFDGKKTLSESTSLIAKFFQCIRQLFRLHFTIGGYSCTK